MEAARLRSLTAFRPDRRAPAESFRVDHLVGRRRPFILKIEYNPIETDSIGLNSIGQWQAGCRSNVRCFISGRQARHSLGADRPIGRPKAQNCIRPVRPALNNARPVERD